MTRDKYITITTRLFAQLIDPDNIFITMNMLEYMLSRCHLWMFYADDTKGSKTSSDTRSKFYFIDWVDQDSILSVMREEKPLQLVYEVGEWYPPDTKAPAFSHKKIKKRRLRVAYNSQRRTP